MDSIIKPQNNMARFLILFSFLFSLLTAGASQPVLRFGIPISGTANTTSTQPKNVSSLPSLSSFIPTIKNGNDRQLVGVFVNRGFALRVVQQPSSNPGYVSSSPEVATQFALATQYGSIGLLAHNTAAGEYFDDLTDGQNITLIYGDGRLKYYRVTQIRRFQALSPTSPYSNFSDLTQPEKILSAETLFYQIYQNDGDLVLQTCIERDGAASWGRLFVIAQPVALPSPENLKNFRQFSTRSDFVTASLF